MRYVSTRGAARPRCFDEVLLSGLAEDGGLYVPEHIPRLAPAQAAEWRRLPYPKLAARIVSLFAADSIPEQVIDDAADAAFERFRHSAIAPLKQLDAGRWLLELFHGPTYAFKDYALQLVGRLIERRLRERGRKILVLCATSGDTGAAAAAAFAGLDNVHIAVLHPLGRVSPVQRRQMTTIEAHNLLNLAVRGTFDDCQSIVKRLFVDRGMAAMNPVAVNSINWARITAQITYYAWAALRLGATARRVDFVVPTGNFGNVLAGFIARQMGFPVGRLILSSNENDVLPRFFHTGTMQSRGVVGTLSPSMDIQVSSNFERFLYELKGRDGAAVREAQEALARNGSYTLDSEEMVRAREHLEAVRCDTRETLAEIARTHEETGEVLCPHTATAAFAARHIDSGGGPPVVIIATAHPAKFPEAIGRALGRPLPAPEALQTLHQRSEHYQEVPADADHIRDLLLRR